MTLNTASPHRRSVGPVALRSAALVAAAGLLLAVPACSSRHDSSTRPTTVAPTISAPPPASDADSARRDMLGGILQSHRDAGEFVGARLALRGPDGTVTEVTSGTATVDAASGAVDPDVPWNVGSVTKSFVAVVVLQLAEEGRVDLDAGIDRYLPDLPGANRITPRQLLQHTSGLGEYIDQPAVVNDPRRHWTPSELIAVAEAAGRMGEPGGAHHYANTNYIVLGEIIEQVTGHPWADEIRTRIVEPLGMTGTGEITDEHPPGYKLVDGSFVDATFGADPSIGGAAGALQSTDRDLLLFARGLADGTLLSPESESAMQTFVPGEDYSQFGIAHGYGLGLERYESDAVTILGHMGVGEAQSAFFGYDPEHGTAVAVMMNTAVPGPQAIMGVEALTAAAGTAG